MKVDYLGRPLFEASPNSLIDYTLDWTGYLAGATISAMTATHTGSGSTASSNFTDTTTTARVRAGLELGAQSVVTFKINYGAYEDSRSIVVKVVAK